MHVYITLFHSVLLTVANAIRILLEDLVVFLSELCDAASTALLLLGQAAEAVSATLEAGAGALCFGLLAGFTAILKVVTACWEAIHSALQSLAIFFNLLGRYRYRYRTVGVDWGFLSMI